MPQLRDPFLLIVDDMVRDGADLILITPQFSELNKAIVIEGVSICNHDGTGGDVEIGVVQSGRFIPRRTNLDCLAGMWYRRMRHETILSNMRIYARFIYEEDGNGDPCGDGNHCEMNVSGYYLEEFTTP